MKYIVFTALILAHSVFGECAIIAHRGASNTTPENTVLSVQTAWDLGADSTEVDLRLSSDDQIVIYHDKDSKRIGGRKKLVEEQTFWELKELDVGAHRGSQFSGLTVPTLREVLDVTPSGRSLFLEIKVSSKILPILEQELEKSKLTKDQIRIIGFDYDTMVEAKSMFPDIQVYWLVGISQNRKHEEWTRAINQILTAAQKGGLDGLCVQGNAVVSRRFVVAAHEQNLKFFVYTVNSKVAARRFKRMGVDGIITDRPQYIRDNI